MIEEGSPQAVPFEEVQLQDLSNSPVSLLEGSFFLTVSPTLGAVDGTRARIPMESKRPKVAQLPASLPWKERPIISFFWRGSRPIFPMEGQEILRPLPVV